MRKKASSVLKYTLSFLLAVVFVYFAFRGIDWSAFWAGLGETRWIWVVWFIVASLLALVFREERWRIMLEPLDPEARRIDAWDSSNVGNLINIVLPGAGEFARCGYIRSPRLPYNQALGTIVCERAWDVVLVLGFFVLALALQWGMIGDFFSETVLEPLLGRGLSLWWIAGPVLLLLLAFAIVVRKMRFRWEICKTICRAFAGLWTGIASFKNIHHKWSFAFHTLGIWVTYLLMTYFIFKAIPSLDHLTLIDALFVSAIGNIASVIPVPGGVGAYHYLVAITLSSIYGSSYEMGILFATLSHELHALFVIVFGIESYASIAWRRRRSSAREA